MKLEPDPNDPLNEPEAREEIRAREAALDLSWDVNFQMDAAVFQSHLQRYRRYRDEHRYPDDACFFLIAGLLEMKAREILLDEELTWRRQQAEQDRLQPRIPPDSEAEDQRSRLQEERRLRVFDHIFREFGEPEMADLFGTYPQNYFDRRERGRLFFRGVDLS